MPREKANNCVTCTKKSACFMELNESDLRFVNEERTELRFKKGEVICKQGSLASSILYLNSGLAKVYLETGDKNLILNVLPGGSMIGLPALFSGTAYPYSAAALEDCTVCSIDIAIFSNYASTNAKFATQLINILNKNTIHSYERFLSLTQKQLNGRFADVLLYLSESVYQSRSFDMYLSRRDLAELTGMSTESVIRLIKEFKEDNIIKVDKKHVEIVDLVRLEKISRVG